MKTQIIYKISYFIFCFLISCFIIFSINKGFQRQDIIIIPVFAILLFLIIDFSASITYKNTIENYDNIVPTPIIPKYYQNFGGGERVYGKYDYTSHPTARAIWGRRHSILLQVSTDVPACPDLSQICR